MVVLFKVIFVFLKEEREAEMPKFKPMLLNSEVVHVKESLINSEYIQVKASFDFNYYGTLEMFKNPDGSINEELVEELFMESYYKFIAKLELQI